MGVFHRHTSPEELLRPRKVLQWARWLWPLYLLLPGSTGVFAAVWEASQHHSLPRLACGYGGKSFLLVIIVSSYLGKIYTCVSGGSWFNYNFILSKLVVVDISGAPAQEHLRRLGFGLQDCFHMPQFWAPRSGYDGLPCILWHPVQGPHQEGSLQGQSCSRQDQSTEGEIQIVGYLFLIHINGFSKSI